DLAILARGRATHAGDARRFPESAASPDTSAAARRARSDRRSLSRRRRDQTRRPPRVRSLRRGAAIATVLAGESAFRAVRYGAAAPIDAIDAIAIESLPDCSVLILDRNEAAGFSQVCRYCFKRRLGDPVSLASVADLIEDDERAGFKLVAHDFVFLPRDAKT